MFSWEGYKACNFWVFSVDSQINTAEHIPIQCKFWKQYLLSICFIACAWNSTTDTVGLNTNMQQWYQHQLWEGFVTLNYTIYRQKLVYIFICSDIIVTWCVIYKQAHSGDSLAAAKVFSVSSLCYDLPCGLVGEVYGGKRQRSPLLQNLSSDEYVLSHLGSGHVSARHWRLFPVMCGLWS